MQTHHPRRVLLAFGLTISLLLGFIASASPAHAGAGNPATAAVSEVTGPQFVQLVRMTIPSARPFYGLDEVIPINFRFESKLAAVQNVAVTDSNVANADKCKWTNLAANGAYNCDQTNGRAFYKVQPADVAAGQVTLTSTWTVTDTTNNVTESVTLTKQIAIHNVMPTEPAISDAATETVVDGQYGLVRTSVKNPKVTYAVGDLINFNFRMESKITESGMQVWAASPTIANIDKCGYTDLPALPSGKYNCALTPQPVYTVTQADIDRGYLVFTSYWSWTRKDNGQSELLIVSKKINTSWQDPALTPTDRVEGEKVTLFSKGTYGNPCYRIPALTKSPINGWLLAAIDGRPASCGDAPEPNSIVQRISKDGGKSWSVPQVAAAGKAAAPKYGYSDPSYVVDRVTNKVFLFFVKSYDAGWGGSVAGTNPTARNVLHAAVTESSDDGLTWSEPQIITADITSSSTWTSRFAASGEGIQKRFAPNAGRLLQQFTIRNSGAMQAVTVYSDDHGATWQVGNPAGTGMDENKVVELSDGRLMMNSRSSSDYRGRLVAYSENGGTNWGPVTAETQLPDPRNNAAIIRVFPEAEAGSDQAKILAFSNANSTTGRENGTVRVSFDDGATWAISRQFKSGSMSYSTLTPLGDGKMGLLYESDNYNIDYTQVSLDWVGVPTAVVASPNRDVYRGANEIDVTVTNQGTSALTGASVSFDAPRSWTTTTTSPVAIPSVPAGESHTFKVNVTVPSGENPVSKRMFFTLTTPTQSYRASALLNLVLRENQFPTESISPLTLNTPVPAQTTIEPSPWTNMFDNNNDTIWHSPWGQTMTFPLDLDVKVGEESRELSWLELQPRAGSVNGRVNGYEIWAGDDLTNLTQITTGNFPNAATTQNIPLNTTAKFVRVRILTTYGDSGANKFASMAEIRVFAAKPDAPMYNVTTVGGTTDRATAMAGATVTLTAGTTPEGKVFDKWTTTPTDLTLTAAGEGKWTFVMPATDVSVTATYTDIPVYTPVVDRWSGKSAINTALQVSKKAFPTTVDTVYIANDIAFPDSLAAVPPVGVARGPLLLVNPKTLDPAVIEELQRLQPKKVFLQGGRLAVTPALEDAIRQAVPTASIHRNSGSSAELTAVKTSESGFTTSTKVYLANVNTFQDALAAGPVAGLDKAPILLAQNNSLLPEVIAEIKRLGAKEVIVVGGKMAIRPELVTKITTDTDTTAVRLSGATDIETAVQIVASSPYKEVFLTNNVGFADALGAGPAAIVRNGVVLLTNGKCLPKLVADEIASKKPTGIHLVGGKAAMDPALLDLVQCK